MAHDNELLLEWITLMFHNEGKPAPEDEARAKEIAEQLGLDSASPPKEITLDEADEIIEWLKDTVCDECEWTYEDLSDQGYTVIE